MDWLQSLVLGIVQGLTEFLPVSSSAHLAITPKLFNWQDQGLAHDAFLHLGTLAAVLIYFRKDIWRIIYDKSEHKLAIAILVATLPAVIIGFSFKSFFSSELIRSASGIAYTLIFGSALIFVAEIVCSMRQKIPQWLAWILKLVSKVDAQEKKISELKFWQVFFVGCMQALALFPGVSRSGACIAASIFTGLGRAEAARFAFLIGIPAIGGAGLLAVKDMLEVHSLTSLNYSDLALGFAAAFISGYIAIDLLIKFLKSQPLFAFVVYRLILAVYLLIAF